MDPFWYCFLQDFKDDEQTRAEQQSKRRLSEILEQHQKDARTKIKLEGELYSH